MENLHFFMDNMPLKIMLKDDFINSIEQNLPVTMEYNPQGMNNLLETVSSKYNDVSCDVSQVLKADIFFFTVLLGVSFIVYAVHQRFNALHEVKNDKKVPRKFRIALVALAISIIITLVYIQHHVSNILQKL